MLKKTQKYLLLHYPLLWNMRVVPMFLALIALNLLFFTIGYLNGFLNFFESYHSPYNQPLTYFAIGLCIIGGFIIWLMNYRKNNAFNVFYPKKAHGLYVEWVLTFVMLFGLFLLPFSFYQGITQKIRSYSTEKEIVKINQLLSQVSYLIPHSKNACFKEFPEGYRRNENGDIIKDAQGGSHPDNNYYDENEIDSIVRQTNNVLNLEEHPNFAQLSLLNCFNNYTDSVDNKVKHWLITQDKARIERLINDFLTLAAERKLPTNLTTKKWMQLIYNPPTYPVSDNNLIRPNIDYYSYNDGSYYNQESHFYVPHSELSSSFNIIKRSYNNAKECNLFLITIACFTCFFSLLIFSNRCSSGKSWLIAFISLLIIGFVSGLLIAIWNIAQFSSIVSINLYILFWIAFFVGELIYIIRLTRNSRNKSKSTIIIHHLFWLLPFIPLLFLSIFVNHISHHHYYSSYHEHVHCTICSIRYFLENNVIAILWSNIALTFVSMWFFILFIVRKWKSLPEK